MSHEFSRFCGLQGLKLADLKHFTLLLLTEKQIYLKDVLGGHCLEYREQQRGRFSDSLLRTAFSCLLPRFWRVDLLTAATLKCAKRKMREHQSCFSAEVRKAQQLSHSGSPRLLGLRFWI